MTSLLNRCFRLMQLRRRYAVVGLFICFTVCFFIYSSIPTRHNDLHRLVFHHSNSDAKPHELEHQGAMSVMKGWLSSRVHGNVLAPVAASGPSTEGKQKAPGREQTTSKSSAAVPPAKKEEGASSAKAVPQEGVKEKIPMSVVRPPPSREALASKRQLGGGGEVFSGSLGQVVLVPFAFNVSAERITRLQENTMLFRQLQHQVRNTRAYLASVQPDFDVNAGACRCGRSISTECSCCAKLTMKRFLLERPACVNFTYVLKDRVLRVRLGYEKKRIAERTLAADTPPMLCAGAAVDLCAAFRNVTYKVQLDSVDHKTSLSGCLDLIMRLKTRPIAIYPMGCFHLVRDPKLVHIDKLNNWMP